MAAVASKTLDPDPIFKPLSFPNGGSAEPLYGDCLRNHAAGLGAHAVDGCGEFLLSSAADPADPASLTCAACGCHRNFHRRLASDVEEEEEEQEKRGADRAPRPDFSSAPHALLALRTGGACVASGRKKRPRTRFGPEQKERMRELAERVGWQMRRRDGAALEERCREIGVGVRVFRVWMHNNKARRGRAAATARRGGSLRMRGSVKEEGDAHSVELGRSGEESREFECGSTKAG